jgi:hypothetical protein
LRALLRREHRSRHHDDLQVWNALFQLLRELDAVAIGEHVIEQGCIRPAVGDYAARVAGAFGGQQFPAGFGHQPFEELKKIAVVVDEENGRV